MFCRKCGKYINGGMHICRDCKAAQKKHQLDAKRRSYANQSYVSRGFGSLPVSYVGSPSYVYRTPAASQPARQTLGGRAYGLGMALSAAIISSLLFLFVAILYEEADKDVLFKFFSLFWVMLVPLFVMLQIFSIVSIVRFVKRRPPYAKPVATLVLGIVGGVFLWGAILYALAIMNQIITFIL